MEMRPAAKNVYFNIHLINNRSSIETDVLMMFTKVTVNHINLLHYYSLH